MNAELRKRNSKAEELFRIQNAADEVRVEATWLDEKLRGLGAEDAELPRGMLAALHEASQALSALCRVVR